VRLRRLVADESAVLDVDDLSDAQKLLSIRLHPANAPTQPAVIRRGIMRLRTGGWVAGEVSGGFEQDYSRDCEGKDRICERDRIRLGGYPSCSADFNRGLCISVCFGSGRPTLPD